MAHMNPQPALWVTPVSHLPPKDQERIIREAFAAQNFPASAIPQKASDPEQRGFIIGSVRL